MFPLRVVAPARSDLISMTAFLATKETRLAIRFRQAVATSFDRLRSTPDLGELWQTNNKSLQGVRVWSIRGFPNHLFFHSFEDGEVIVLRILHASQDSYSIFSGVAGDNP